MLKKYQVFVSSTRDDLVDERKSVSQALLESNCIPAGMELFPASNRTSWEIIKNAIDDSDYYLLIIAGRYGTLFKDENGDYSKCSYIEKEFDYALEIKKPIIAFLYEDIDNLPSKKVERSDKGKKRLEAFREKVKNSKRQVSFWNSTGDLVSKIKTAIQALKETSPEGGWIKEDDSLRLFEASHSEMLAVFDKWKLTKIFKTRAEKNSESDPLLEKHNVQQLDGIAFGLRSFRTMRKIDVLECLNNGMNVRFLVMNPTGPFITQREREENAKAGTIAESIEALVEWAKDLNNLSRNGKITMKYYDSMTLDFYWRIDDVVYVGPYLLSSESQATITYKFEKGGRGFALYSNYFEELWDNTTFCHTIVE